MKPALFFLWAALASGVSAKSMTPQDVNATLEQIGFDQKVGTQVPLNLKFMDEIGQPVTLSHYFQQGKPVIINLVYYRCPMLCTEVLNGLTRALRTLKFNAGEQFTIVTLSIDPREKSILAAKKGNLYRTQYERHTSPEGWAFLTGDETSIKALADAVGFRYVYDKETDQYGHAAGLVVLTPEGKVSRYILGVEFSPKDLRFALIDAASGTIGTAVDQAIMFCYQYDPAMGRYGVAIMRLVRAGGLVTLFLMAAFVITSIRKEKFA